MTYLRELAARAVSDRPLVILIALGLAVRLVYIAASSHYQLLFDALDFHVHAQSIAAGDGYPDSTIAAAGGPSAFRPPAFAYLLGGLYAVVGDNVTTARIFSAVIGTATIPLTISLAANLRGRRVALVAGGLMALFPPLIVLETAVLSESLFLVVELSVLVLLLRARGSDRAVVFVMGAGVLCGVAALTRSNGWLLLIPAAVGAVGAIPRPGMRWLAGPAVLAASAVLVIAPWAIRNTVAFDQFTPTTTQAGFGLAGTYNEAARNDPELRATWQGERMLEYFAPLFARKDLNEAELGDALFKEGREYAVSNPQYVVKATALNSLRSAGVLEDGFQQLLNVTGAVLTDWELEVLRWSTVVFVLLAISGAAISCATRSIPWGPLFVWLTPILMLVSAMPISGDPRYRAPADPFLAILAAIALVAAWGWVTSRQTPAETLA